VRVIEQLHLQTNQTKIQSLLCSLANITRATKDQGMFAHAQI
jgi:hypothetical protein